MGEAMWQASTVCEPCQSARPAGPAIQKAQLAEAGPAIRTRQLKGNPPPQPTETPTAASPRRRQVPPHRDTQRARTRPSTRRHAAITAVPNGKVIRHRPSPPSVPSHVGEEQTRTNRAADPKERHNQNTETNGHEAGKAHRRKSASSSGPPARGTQRARTRP